MSSRIPQFKFDAELRRFTSILLLLLPCFFLAQPGARAQEPVVGVKEGAGLRVRLNFDPRARLFSPLRWNGLSLAGFSGTFEKRLPRGMVHKVSLDSTGSVIIANETFHGSYLRIPNYVPLRQFLDLNARYKQRQQWRELALQNLYYHRTESRGPGGINIEIPVEIKSKAFQKIFGGDRVGLNVQGEIRIDGGFRNESRSEVRTSIAQGSNTNFKMNQTQRFTVTGKIGEKVTVNVDQDSERTLDFENNIKLNYKGFEDEIIQSIEAGNISLSLPGTRFVTFSGKSTGLFGVKMDMQLGDLHMTTIASQEKGESQKLSAGGSAEGSTTKIEDYRFVRNTYFFLDERFREQYRHYAFKWQHVYDPSIAISRIDVYKYEPGNVEKADAIFGYALLDPNNPADTAKVGTTKEYFRGHFIKLDPDRDYFVEKSLGYLVMNQRLDEREVLAVAYEDSSGRQFGSIDHDVTSTQPLLLKMIKPESPQPSNETWDLEWKNVYYLGSRNIEKDGFELKVFKRAGGAGIDNESQGADSYLTILGLDTRDLSGNLQPDGELDDDPNVINWARGELVLPYLRPFDPDTIFVNGAPELSSLVTQDFERLIYDTTNTSVIVQESKFYIQVKSSSKSSTYNLGFNVIENSEEVILNGEVLTRGTDYTIDYWSGSLTVLDERATLPSSKVDITYERNQLFQLQKKTILGTRAEYRFNKDSFLGGTLLYLNERTLDQKVRVGSGPMRNFVWDLNASFNFKPNFLTRALDALPFVQAKQPSRLKFEGEIAQVMPNPNTLNSRETSDNSGVAYIDDFEGAKRTTPLGITRRGYTLASAPQQYIPGSVDSLYQRSMAKMGQLVWYNPFLGVPIREVQPNREVNAQTSQTMDILTMRFTPSTDGSFPATESWVGIMRALSAGFFDQTESKFLEVLVAGDRGVLHIDLGQISEDVIPNKRYDTEDNLSAGGIREGLLDADEDIGLDRMANNDPRASAAGADFWDINNNGVKEPFEPFSNDDWSYTSGSTNYEHINGTENNANDGIREPDTEDLNGNGTTDLVNNYFEYTINLSDLHPDTSFIAGRGGVTPEGLRWKLYRIPLSEPTLEVGTPSLTLIEYVRLWVNGVDSPTLLKIAELNLVGNEWREHNPTDERLAIAVINTHENPDYVQPPGVEGVRDRITRVRAREQSLVLEVNDLEPDSTVYAEKSFFDVQNYIHYKRMRMFVYAKDFTLRHIRQTAGTEAVAADTANSDIAFFLRFGSNNRNYYEFRELVFEGNGTQTEAWNPRNEMDIDLAQLTNLKFDPAYEAYRAHPDSIPYFEVQLNETQWIRIIGEPSLTNIRVLFAGVENLGTVDRSSFTGEIWLNELRLSDIEKEKGVAMRARMDLAMSDVITMNAELTRQDADFHNVGTRFGSGDNRLAATINGNVRLDKFLPQSFGLSLPLTINYSESQSTPKYAPGKDILIGSETPADVLNVIRSRTINRGFGISFSKRTPSKNFFVKNTFDRLRASLSMTNAAQSSPTIARSTRTAWSANIDYGLQFGQKTFIRPFKFLGKLPLLKNLGETKLYYLPRSINGKIQGNTTRSKSVTRLGAPRNTYTYDITRSFSTNIKIFESLNSNFSRSWTGDFRNSKWQGLFSGDFEDLNKLQNLNLDYTPKLFSWITNKFSYTTNYRFTNNITQQRTGRSAGTNANLSANVTLKFSQLFKKRGSSRNRPRSRRRQPPGRRAPPGQKPKPGEKKKSETKEKKGGKPNPLSAIKLFVKAFSKFRDINVTFARRRNYTSLGLDRGEPSFRYKIGLTSNPEVPFVADLSTNRSTENITKTLSVSTGLQLAKNVDITLRFSHDENRNQTTQTTGNYSDSWVRLGDGKGFPFPEWTVNITGLEKLKLLSKLARTISISHNFTGKRNVVWNKGREQKNKEDFTISFRPLIKVNINWKNGMVSSLTIDETSGYNDTFNPIFEFDELVLRQVGGVKTTQENISFSTTYTKRGGFRLPLPFLKNKELKNTVDFSVTFTKNKAKTENLRGDSGQYAISNERESWTFEPRVTYSFSNRVRGGAHFQVGKTKSTHAGDVAIKEFGVDINISIRGN